MSWGKAFSDAWESATDSAKEAVTAAKESMEAAADLAIDVADAAKETAEKAAEAAKATAIAAANKTKEISVATKYAAVDAAEAASDAWERATVAAKETVYAIKDSPVDFAVEVVETARDNALRAAQEAQDAAVEAAKKTKEAAVAFKYVALETAEAAKDTAIETAKAAKDTALEAAEAAKNAAIKAAVAVKHAAVEKAEKVRDDAIAFAVQIKESAIATKDKVINTAVAIRDAVANTYTAVKQKFALYSAENASIHACPNKDKTLGDLNCPDLAKEAAQVADAKDKAKLADAIYADRDEQDLPDGVTHATDEDLKALGLINSKGQKMTEIPNSDFKSEVYKKADGSYVVAFKGTTFSSTEDWNNNIQQGMGNKSKYYTRAMRISAQIADSTDSANIEYVGHSLGGGLASAAAAVSGAPATTFNAAGLNDKTLAEVGFVSNPDNINAYTVKGDILSSLQDNASVVASTAAGNRMPLSPADSITKGDVATGVVGSLVATPLVGVVAGSAKRGVRLHSMGSVKDALNKRADQISLVQKSKGCP